MAAVDSHEPAGGRNGTSAVPALAIRFARSASWAGARVFSVVLLAVLWEALARSGAVTPFQLPALSAV
ncbi:MAG: hypothetical protein ACM3W7_06135, partial [Acidobacteriota bacterium]